MPKYVLSGEANAHGVHEVHKISCSEKPVKQIPLGIHADSRYALMEARKRHREWNLQGCTSCSPEASVSLNATPSA